MRPLLPRRLPSRRLLCLLTGLLLGAPSPALAGFVSIVFDLSPSTIEILGGAITIPPEGSILAASARVIAGANGPESVLAGPIVLKSLALQVSINGDIGTGASLTGSVGAGQVGTLAGNLNGGLTQGTFPGTLVLNITGSIDCTGFGCGFLGSFPVLLSGPDSFTSLPAFNVGNVNSSLMASLSATAPLSFTLAGLTAIMNLTGTEVNRTFVVPEPSTAGLLALGLLCLAGGGWLRLRSGRR